MIQHYNKRLIIFLVIGLVIAGILLLCIRIYSDWSYNDDLKSLSNNNVPHHFFCKDAVNDGGTQIYYGVGYTVIVWHRIDDSYDEKKGTRYICGWEVHRGINFEFKPPDINQINDFHYEYI